MHFLEEMWFIPSGFSLFVLLTRAAESNFDNFALTYGFLHPPARQFTLPLTRSRNFFFNLNWILKYDT